MSEFDSINKTLKRISERIELLDRKVSQLQDRFRRHQTRWITGERCAELMNRANPRFLQEWRKNGTLKLTQDYYWDGRQFLYREERIIEIRDVLINKTAA